MTTTVSSAGQCEAVHGRCKWVGLRPDARMLECGTACLRIETESGVQTNYLVRRWLDDEGWVMGYRLTRLDFDGGEGEAVYDLPADFSLCECWDHMARDRTCKHMSSLPAALAAVGLL